MKDYKLTIQLLPRGAWGNDFSKTLPKKEWDVLRNNCYKKANYKCEICGYETNELDAHEVWNFDIKSKTQTLVDIVALCSKCHGVKHMRNSQRQGFGENAKRHFIKVNNCSELDFASHLAYAQMEYEEMNKIYRWKINADLKKFGGENIIFKQQIFPFIITPYTSEDIEKLSKSVSFAPRILAIDIDNYEGIIRITSDRTNKIEWFSNGIVATKFNFANTFKTEISVKNLDTKLLYFKLYGKFGEMISKKFQLIEYK